MNNKLNNTVLYIIIIALLFLYISERFNKPQVITEKDSQYHYVTDTILKNEYFKLLEAYKLKTPPKTIIKWLKPEAGKDNIIEKVPDSIIIYIKGLEERLAISDGFLKNYPKASKLINFELTKDTLSIITLNTDSDLGQEIFPLYFDNWEYIWVDNNLTRKSIPKQKFKWDFKEVYLNTGNDFITGKPFISIEHNLNYKRFKLDTELIGTFQDTDQSNFKVKLGYRLFK